MLWPFPSFLLTIIFFFITVAGHCQAMVTQLTRTLFHFSHILLPSFLSCSATFSIFPPPHPSSLSLHRSSCDVYSHSWDFGFSKTGRRVEPFIFNLINSIQSLFTSFPPLSCNQHLPCRHKQVLSWTISTILSWQNLSFLLAQRQAGVIWAISLAARISNCLSITTFTSQFLFFPHGVTKLLFLINL